MYIGIDHGTTAIRFASPEGNYKISRSEAVNFRHTDLKKLFGDEEIEGIAICYSMGDGISSVTSIEKVKNRGIITREGAGEHIGGGTKVFDEVKKSGIPAAVIPGIHRGSPTDPRFKVYSHQTSPEKIGIAYEVCRDLGGDVVVCDCSSNTVTVLVQDGKIVGALDACIFAPGMVHGALDVDAIRRIDCGECTANEAFQRAGVSFSIPPEVQADALAMFAAMECGAMLVLNSGAKVAIAGSLAHEISGKVQHILGRQCSIYNEWCASHGLSKIAEDVYSGKKDILGISVDI